MKHSSVHKNGRTFVPFKLFTFGVQVPGQGALSELKDQLLRARADLRNAQARMHKDQTNLVFATKESLLGGILPVIDDFERALEQYRNQPRSEQLDAWFVGFELIVKRLQQLLLAQGVREIDCSRQFDPRYHEAIAQVTQPGKNAGDIVAVLQKGYLLNERVLRPARVSVAQ